MSLNVKSFQTLSAMSVGEIISRSWRLYRLNFKQVILYSIIGTPIMLIAQLLLNMPSAFSNSDNPAIAGAICCFVYPVGMAILALSCFIAIFFNTLLIQAFFNILTGESIEYKKLFSGIKNKMGRLTKTTLFILGQAIPFYIIDCIIIIVMTIAAIILAISISTLLNHMGGSSPSSLIGSTIFFIIFLVLFLLIFIPFMMLIFSQFLVCCLQLVILSVEKPMSLWDCFKRSMILIYKNFGHAIFFSFCLISIWYVFTMYFNIPIIIYSFIEVFKDGIVPRSQATYPMHVLVISSIWGSLAGMLIWPFIVSAITLFYYDIKVRTEGFDLSEALKFQQQ